MATQAFREDLTFEFAHAGDLEKVPVMSDEQWGKWLTDLMKPFTKVTVKKFDLKNKEVARQWIAE